MQTNSKTVSNNNWQTGTAYIVETRPHPNLALVLKNADECLPTNWNIIIFCSSENLNYANSASHDITTRNISLIKLEKPIKSLEDYNNLLLSTKFWKNFETENLLGFQVDSLINFEQKNQLHAISQFDYVGAPWSKRIRQRWDYIPSYGGNGGICFSKLSARLHALEKSQYPRKTGAPHHQILNEDIWFSHSFHELGMRLPSEKQAKEWFVESQFSKNPFAVHKPWSYISKAEYQKLLAVMPKLKEIQIGFNSKTRKDDGQNYRNFLLRYARECFKNDNFYQTDLALQVCQSRFPTDPVSYNLHAKLAYRLGLYKQALTFVSKSLNLQANFKKAQENKVVIENTIKRDQNTNHESQEKYLLIHSWGSGLGFDLLYLLKQLMVAELTNRTPVVYWGNNSLYNNHPNNNCYTDYFEPISTLELKDISAYQKNCYPAYWQNRSLDDYSRQTRWKNKLNKQTYSINGLYYLNRNETLVIAGEFSSIKMLTPWIPETHAFAKMPISDIYRHLMAKYIRPKPYLIKRANDFLSSAFNNGPFIAIHLRGTDKQQEKQSNDIADINQQLINELDTLDRKLPIFVMTDDIRQISNMQKHFGNRVKSIDVTRGDGDKFGVHHTAKNKKTIAEEVIVDMLIAAQSQHFFGCGFSYLACCVNSLHKNQANTTLKPFDITTRFMNIPKLGEFGIH